MAPHCTENLASFERTYRVKLDDEPADMESRVGLAWCLFLLSVHHFGRESVENSGPSTHPNTQRSSNLNGVPCVRDSGSLLRECLRQTIIVTHLSRDANNRAEVARIQRLVTMSGGECAVKEAEAESIRILAEITRELGKRRPERVRSCVVRGSTRPQET